MDMLNELQNLYMITNKMTIQGDSNVACMYAMQSTIAKMIKELSSSKDDNFKNNKQK